MSQITLYTFLNTSFHGQGCAGFATGQRRRAGAAGESHGAHLIMSDLRNGGFLKEPQQMVGLLRMNRTNIRL